MWLYTNVTSHLLAVEKVFVFHTVDDGVSWSHTQTLASSDGHSNDHFGYAISFNESVCAVHAAMGNRQGTFTDASSY